MFKFQEMLFEDDEKASGRSDQEDQLAAIVTAARRSFPDEVLHPVEGEPVHVDRRTGRALEAMWHETASIYGYSYVNDMRDPEKNPLCRGVYVYPDTYAYTVWDNRGGEARRGLTDYRPLAELAAQMTAKYPSEGWDVDDEIDNARRLVLETIQDGTRDAWAAAAAAAEARVAALSHHSIDSSELIDACDQLATLSRLKQCPHADDTPLSADYILEHSNVSWDDLKSPEFYNELVAQVTNLAKSTRAVDMEAVRETTRGLSFWNEVAAAAPQGAEPAEEVETTAAEFSEMYASGISTGPAPEREQAVDGQR